VITKSEKMGLRKPPLVFTEQGVAMLSGVLNSDRAISVNIQIKEKELVSGPKISLFFAQSLTSRSYPVICPA
jgi:hypothetical protein